MESFLCVVLFLLDVADLLGKGNEIGVGFVLLAYVVIGPATLDFKCISFIYIFF